MNNFILTYDPLTAPPSAGQLLNHMRVNRFIAQFHQPYPGTFFVKSYESAYNLTESIKGLFDTSPFTLIQFNSAYAGGSLAPEIWHWMNYGLLPSTPVTGYLSSALDALKNTPPSSS